MFGALVVVLGVTLGGCFPSPQTSFDSPAPSKRLDAIVDAAAKNDRSSTAQLVQMLKSEEPAERMLAIRTLERITKETYGYHHQDPEWKRQEAIIRWETWLESEVQSSGGPGAGEPTTPSGLAATRGTPQQD